MVLGQRLLTPASLVLAVVLTSACLAPRAQAQLFGDDQARQAILELRERFDEAVRAQNELVEENTAMRRSLLNLQSELDATRSDLARLRGEQEELQRQMEELTESNEAMQQSLAREQSRGDLRDRGPVQVAGMRERARDLEPSGSEQSQYDAALQAFRGEDFQEAQARFARFAMDHSGSDLIPDALFWLGNAQYATRNYAEAIANFQTLVRGTPDHGKAPEAMLAIANCQIEIGQDEAARSTLESLRSEYPDSEAADAARERLSDLR